MPSIERQMLHQTQISDLVNVANDMPINLCNNLLAGIQLSAIDSLSSF